MNGFRSQYSSIRGISDKRRLPRLGKIRLGFKAKTGSGTEYPVELPFFSLPAEVAQRYGFKDAQRAIDRAKELGVTRQAVLDYVGKFYGSLAEEIEVMFPINEREAVFPQAYKWYGSQRGLRCMGNGETALRGAAYIDETAFDEKGNKASGDGAMIEIQCPCAHLKSDINPKGDCVRRATLSVIVPKVSVGGIYQIDLSSYNSMVDVNSGLDYVTALTQGRFAMILLKLRRVPTVTHHADAKGEAQKQTHWTLQVILDAPADRLNDMIENSRRVFTDYALPPPEDVNPERDIPEEGIFLIEDAPNVTGVTAPEKQIEGEVVDEKPETPESMYSVTLDAIRSAGSVPELQDVWRSVNANWAKYSEKELEQLTAEKDARKKKFAKK